MLLLHSPLLRMTANTRDPIKVHAQADPNDKYALLILEAQ
ncbi:hypothetical protein ABIA32_003839 [Streptacidiphilus sp. MAP12-20]